jgi:hypothetical protein
MTYICAFSSGSLAAAEAVEREHPGISVGVDISWDTDLGLYWLVDVAHNHKVQQQTLKIPLSQWEQSDQTPEKFLYTQITEAMLHAGWAVFDF